MTSLFAQQGCKCIQHHVRVIHTRAIFYRSEREPGEWTSTMKNLRLVFLLIGVIGCVCAYPSPPVYTARTPHGQVSYFKIGQGTPVILLHGLFANKEQWLPLVEHLLKHQAPHQYIIPDLPGFGASNDFPMTIYNLTTQDYAELNQVTALHDFLTSLHITPPVALAGNSLGGVIATYYAEKFPKEVSSLTFMGSPLGVAPFTALYYQKLAQGFNPFIPLTQPQFLDELNLLMMNVKPNLPSSEKITQHLQANTDHFQKLATIFTMINTYHHCTALMEPLPKIQVPVFIFWGVEDRLFGDIEHAYFLKSRFTESPMRKVVALKNAGHVVMLESDEVLEKIALNYLRFLEETAHEIKVEFA